jgi:hypothetical protein
MSTKRDLNLTIFCRRQEDAENDLRRVMRWLEGSLFHNLSFLEISRRQDQKRRTEAGAREYLTQKSFIKNSVYH